MSSPVDLSQIPHDFDSLVALDRCVAAQGQTDLVCQNAKLALQPTLYAFLRITPAPGGTFTERPNIVLNFDGGAVYEASHRAFLTVADSPGATEAPTIHHSRDRGVLMLTPDVSNFYVAAADVFEARIVMIQQDAPEKYRLLCHWTLGESVSGGTNKHPRWGLVTGHYCGSVAGRAVSSVTARLGGAGGMASGSHLTVYGTESALLSPSHIYDLDESWSTSGIWRPTPTDKAMFRRVMKIEGLPSPGTAEVYALPDTNLSVRTARIQEVWIVDESAGESEDPGDSLGFSITGTQLTVASPSGARDFSGYDYAYVVLHFARP